MDILNVFLLQFTHQINEDFSFLIKKERKRKENMLNMKKKIASFLERKLVQLLRSFGMVN